MGVHLAKFFGLLEAVRTAVRGILAFEIEVSASLTGCISIAFDLAPLAFVAVGVELAVNAMRRGIQTVNKTYHAIEIYRFLFALVCVFPFAFEAESSFFLFFPLPVPVSAGLSALEDCRCPFILGCNATGVMGEIGDSARYVRSETWVSRMFIVTLRLS
jgi:hypothetical protein